jgi:hypothetical protein
MMIRGSLIHHTLGMVGALAVASCDSNKQTSSKPPRAASAELVSIAQDLPTSLPLRTPEVTPAVALLVYADQPLFIVKDHVEIPLLVADIDCPDNDAVCEQFEQKHGQKLVPGYDFVCTATFINETTIVTASHCIRPSKWQTGYVLLNHLENAKIAGDRGSIPVTQVARLSCLKSSVGKSGPRWDGNSDWAIIKLEPLGTHLAEHETRRLGFRSGPDAKLVVQSHVLGLPLLEHVAQTTREPSALRFTNAGGGSGSPVLEHDLIVGIVRGKGLIAGACPSNDARCWESVTWSELIKDKTPPPQDFDIEPPRCTTEKEM